MKNNKPLRVLVAIVLGLVVLLGGGLVFLQSITDPGAPKFIVHNESGQTLLVGPLGSVDPPERLVPGGGGGYQPPARGCETRVWVAKSLSGEVVAQSSGSCWDYTWTIRGPNDSTYEWHCTRLWCPRP